MASTSSTSFERSLELFRGDLSKDQEQQFKNANLDDLNDTIQKMQARLGRDKRLCNFRRIEKFLGAMKEVEQLVTIFLNVHEVVAFVWGPIKLALMAATAWADSIKQLLDVYEEIGEALSNLAFFHTLIKSKEHLRLILADYFSDILRFHRCVLDVFSRPNWKTFFKAAWGSFRRQVQPIIQSLKRRQDMLSDDKLQSHAILEGVRDSRTYVEGRFDRLEAGLNEIRTALEVESLRSQTSSHDQDMKDLLEDKLDISRFGSRSRLDSPESSSPSAGDWVSSDPTFQSWEGVSSQSNVLFLNGSPGAGKTTLARKIIRHLESKQPTHGNTVYFFFRHDDGDRRSVKPMLRAILAQLIRQDETILRYLYEKCAPMSSNMELSSIKTLQDLAQDCLISQPSTSVILDGLDECSENEPSTIITWFLEEVLPSATSRGCHLRLLVCGQRDGRLDHLLSAQPQIRLDTVNSHQRDIEEYCKSRGAEISARFSQAPEQEEELVRKVAQASQGMFLYAKVVMSNFLSMDSVDEFEDEMESDKFPNDLEKAYERIVQRVVEHSKPSRQKTVKKMLGWIICATRPLRWREIQSRFCIDADKGTCNAKRRRLDSCKDIGSSLVDVAMCDLFRSAQSEQIVYMVHETAIQYLVRRGTIDLLQQHAEMALFCCRYLSSQPFLEYPENEAFQNAIRSGYFGFLDYATTHYSHHIQEALKDTSDVGVDIVTSAVRLLKSSSDDASDQSIHDKEPSTLTLTNALCEEGTKGLIQDRADTIRMAMESQHDDLSADHAYLDLSGPLRFKCPRVHCSKFSTGFRDKDTRDRHIKRHQRPFRCIYADCFAHVVGCESREALDAHAKAFHLNDSDSAIIFPSTRNTKPKDIFKACETGSLEEVKRFHLAGAQLNGKRPKGFATPLYLAAQAGHAHVCKYLINQGINPFQSLIIKGQKRSPMLEAINQRHTPIVELFIHTDFDFQDEANISQVPHCIAFAIFNDVSESLELLLETRTCSEHAAMIEDVLKSLVKEPSRHYRDEPSADSTLVHAWFRRAFPNLYHNRTSVSDADSLVKWPDSAEYRTCKETLLQSNSRLHQAIGNQCHPLSMFLLDFADKEDFQLKDREVITPIHRLAQTSCFATNCEKCPVIMQRIIQIDGAASANTPDTDGNLPIYKAAGISLIPTGVFQTLILHTHNLNYRNYQGESVIEFASTRPEHVRMLLKTGRIDLLNRNNRGQTVFSSAVRNPGADADVLKVLIEADPTLAWTADDTEDRATPLDHAMKLNYVTPLSLDNQERKVEILLSVPGVENVLRRFLTGTMGGNAGARNEVRALARRKNLERAIEVMDRIGF